MEQDNHFTDVIFKVSTLRDSRGQVDAIFPGLSDGRDPYTVQGYSHIGQHFCGTVGYWQTGMRTAKPEEYASLLRELESIGYRVRVVKRCTRHHLAQRRKELQS